MPSISKYIFLVFFIPLFSFGQKDYAFKIMDTLCSDFYSGRGYVDNGCNKSAEFIVSELNKIGVKNFPGYPMIQKYGFDVNTFPNDILVKIGDSILKPGIDYLLNSNSGSSIGSYYSVKIKANKIEESIKKLKSVDNPIAIFNSLNLSDKDSITKYRQLAFAATKYCPVVWITNSKLTYSVGRYELDNAMITLKSNKFYDGKEIDLDIKNKFETNYRSKNIIGYIPGKRKNKYIVLTGHYDHLGKMGQAMFPGANDNASGVSMLLSLAKHYIKKKSKYGIVLMFFSGEEAGLEGSKYFVQHPFFRLNRVKFLLNIDILGGASKGITAVNGSKHKRHFKLMQKINKQFDLLPLVKKRGPTKNSDHYYFSKTGVPCFFIYSMGIVKNYHDVNDKASNTPLNNFNKVMELFTRFLSKL